MKTLSIFAALILFINTSNAQDSTKVETTTDFSKSTRIYGSLQVEYGILNDAPALFGYRIAANVITKKNIYMSLGYYSNIYLTETLSQNDVVVIDNVNTRTKDSESISSLKEFTFKIGYSDDISKSFMITPYLGLGYQIIERTTNKVESTTTILDLTSLTTETSTYYQIEKTNSFVIPVGVDFHLHGGNVGFVFGPYINISKYFSAGINLGLTFGNLK